MVMSEEELYQILQDLVDDYTSTFRELGTQDELDAIVADYAAAITNAIKRHKSEQN
jgi:hypothetical protein